MSTAYDDFLDILKKFRTLSVTALGTGAAVPFFAYVAKIAPPWPPGVMLLTALTELVCLILVFQFLRTKGRKPVNRAMAIMAPLLFLVSLGYLTLISVFTYVTPHTGERFTKGFICKPEIQRVYPSECPLVSRDVLSDSQYTAENVWMDWSIELMQVLIASLWLAAFILLSSLIGAFLVFQTKTPAAGARARKIIQPASGNG
ncbi:MAG: hypothetical protein QOJ84_76 [Bradyrhizobium sp.]|jgi:hypothetical protein|nr:hypothetical protein [Bradyrhizobium sp.]